MVCKLLKNSVHTHFLFKRVTNTHFVYNDAFLDSMIHCDTVSYTCNCFRGIENKGSKPRNINSCTVLGKYMDGDVPDPKRWKANFRCALNSLPDVEELKNKGLRKGNNAFKIYRFLDEKKYKSKCRQNSNSRGRYN